MGNPFKSAPKPKPVIIPPPEATPPPPERSDAETSALAEQQRKKFSGGQSGRASTFLTGAGTTASTSAVRFLGGAAST